MPRYSVLVIDDNRDAADTMKVWLELSGFPTAVARTGPAGLALAFEHAPPVILLDIGLPVMDGFAVAAALRADPRTAGCRLVAVSGYGTTEDRARTAAAGFAVHFTKPADPVEVLTVIRAAIEPPVDTGRQDGN